MLMTFLSRLLPRRRVKVELIRRDAIHLRASEWVSDPDSVKAAATILGNRDLQAMLDVVRRESPSNISLAPNTALDIRAMWQAQIQGYTQAIDTLEALGRYKAPVKTELEATFEAPDQEQE